jgi:monomeric sarcosine oxidase
MTDTYDVIVLGAGAMGSAAAYYLAKSGKRVLVLEQFEIDHRYGSSWGYTRIIRYAYDEPRYVALMREAFPLWNEVEQEGETTLYVRTGGIDFGSGDVPRLANTISSLEREGIDHEVLSAAEANKRFPQFNFSDEMTVVYQKDSGIITPSRAVQTHIRLAEKYGAEVREHTTVSALEIGADDVTVKTAKGETFSAARLVVTAGAWTGKFLGEQTGLNLPLQPLRCQEAQFTPPNNHYDANEMPVYIYHREDETSMYGLPSYEGYGVKAAFHGGKNFDHPSEISYIPEDEEVTRIRVTISPVLPMVRDAPLALTRICLYTMTPDEHFIVDQHPLHPHIIIGAGCSGHSFKFSTLLGKMLSDLAINGSTPHDTSLFKLSRFALG